MNNAITDRSGKPSFVIIAILRMSLIHFTRHRIYTIYGAQTAERRLPLSSEDAGESANEPCDRNSVRTLVHQETQENSMHLNNLKKRFDSTIDIQIA